MQAEWVPNCVLGKGLTTVSCPVGINFTTDDYPSGSIAIVDSTFIRAETGILINQNPKNSKEEFALTLKNFHYNDVDTIVHSDNSDVNLDGGTGTLNWLTCTHLDSTGGRNCWDVLVSDNGLWKGK